MIVPLLLATAIALDVDIRRVVLLAAVAYLPELVAAGIALMIWRGRPGEDTKPALFCEAVASELRAGSTLRQAVAGAAVSVAGLVVGPDRSLGDLADDIATEFPQIEQELRLTLVAAARTGSDAAALFDEIGFLALAQSEIRREVRVATAPGRATALVLVGAPVAYVLGQAGGGGLADLLASPQQRVVALLGLGLLMLGLALAAVVVWRAER
ncbi:MAG TPA: hypothetical protein VJ948_05405 [Acidimicrobiia bacterium]|nr:hypothetical protein [Acidimicrobiia bacterium]